MNVAIRGIVGVQSRGILRLPFLGELVGMAIQPLGKVARRELTAVAEWGRRRRIHPALAWAKQSGLPCLALEDGFLRSLGTGDRFPPLSIVVDEIGVFYDSTRPSTLENLLNSGDDLLAGIGDGRHPGPRADPAAPPEQVQPRAGLVRPRARAGGRPQGHGGGPDRRRHERHPGRRGCRDVRSDAGGRAPREPGRHHLRQDPSRGHFRPQARLPHAGAGRCRHRRPARGDQSPEPDGAHGPRVRGQLDHGLRGAAGRQDGHLLRPALVRRLGPDRRPAAGAAPQPAPLRGRTVRRRLLPLHALPQSRHPPPGRHLRRDRVAGAAEGNDPCLARARPAVPPGLRRGAPLEGLQPPADPGHHRRPARLRAQRRRGAPARPAARRLVRVLGRHPARGAGRAGARMPGAAGAHGRRLRALGRPGLRPDPPAVAGAGRRGHLFRPEPALRAGAAAERRRLHAAGAGAGPPGAGLHRGPRHHQVQPGAQDARRPGTAAAGRSCWCRARWRTTPPSAWAARR